MFDDISPRYDLLNDLLSAGTHRIWKRDLVDSVLASKPQKILDCATGTGDIAFLFEKNGVKNISACDFSPQMINFAKERKLKAGSLINFSVADVSSLPFKNDEFDAATISFGIRNVEDIKKSLQELSRTSKSLSILEFGSPKNNLWKNIYFLSLKMYFPILSVLTKRSDAYDYLIKSSENFPSAEAFIQILKENTNYSQFHFRPLFGGIAYIYEAKR